MAIEHRFWRSLIVVPCMLCGLAMAGPSTTFREHPGVSATLELEEGECRDTVPVTVRTGDPKDLKRGSKALSTVVAWARINVQMSCPQARVLQVAGMAGEALVYRGEARRAEGWALVETPGAASPGAASALAGAKGPAATPCDTLAAHPDDPEAVAAGVADEKLDAKAVIRACEALVKTEPAAPRLKFQLARAYLKADRSEDAVDMLLAAAEDGHGGALAYLGDLYVGGARGIEADPVLARTLYEKAVASGFAPAAAVLAEFEDMTEAYERSEAAEAAVSSGVAPAALKPWAMPNVMDNLMAGKLDAIEFNESWVKEYLFNIADNIRAICESDFTQRDIDELRAYADADLFNLGQAQMGAALMGGMAALANILKNPNAVMAQAQASAGAGDDPFEAGMKDTEALFQRHLCKTPGLSAFSRNLKAYVRNEQAPVPPPNAIMNACLRDPLPSKYKASDFCLCFAGGLNGARVSQANRKLLATNFREAASRIVGIERNRGQFQACRTGF